MSERSDLLSWRVQNAPTDFHAARVLAHPRFAEAARALAANSLAAGDNDKALAGIQKDAGRYVAAMWAMHLHVSGGLTLPRLKEICAASGFLSPGRARAMLFYMRYLGYITAAERGRGEPQRYVPTVSFRQSWRAQHRAALEAASVVEPAVQLVLDRLDEDLVLDRISQFQAEGLLSLSRVRDQQTSLIRIFMHRLAGNQIIFTLVTQGAGDDFPPYGEIAFSIAAAAQHFGVSRIHIRRILNDAVREGFMAFANDGIVVLTEKAREELHTSYAMQLAQLLASAAEALAQLSGAEPADADRAALAMAAI